MNWDQILEIQKTDQAEIGNHRHSHEYLFDESAEIIKDVNNIIADFTMFSPKKLSDFVDFSQKPDGFISSTIKSGEKLAVSFF